MDTFTLETEVEEEKEKKTATCLQISPDQELSSLPEELFILASSPHGRLQLRAEDRALPLVLFSLADSTPALVVDGLHLVILLCQDCDCALQLAQLGLHHRLSHLLVSSDPDILDLVYLAIQAADDGLPLGLAFPLPRGLPGLHPPLPHTFQLPHDVHLVARAETCRRLSSQQDVGQRLWPAALVLARWLLRTAPAWIPASVHPSTCRLLELGAGLGLTGLAAAQVGQVVTH